MSLFVFDTTSVADPGCFFDTRIWDSDPGWNKIRIRDKHPGSATLDKTHIS
jgi:hypothetical protein